MTEEWLRFEVGWGAYHGQTRTRGVSSQELLERRLPVVVPTAASRVNTTQRAAACPRPLRACVRLRSGHSGRTTPRTSIAVRSLQAC